MLLRSLLVVVLAVGAAVAEDFPLPALGYADTVALAEGWRFAWDDGDRGFDQGWARPDYDRSDWTAIDLPRVWDREPGTVRKPIRKGVGWFARRIRIPEDWDGEAVLQFLGVQYQCDCWVDGAYVGLHLGGYTPFAFPLGEHVEPGGEHLVVLRVDNRLSQETVPSTKIAWQYYGGVTREVYLAHRAPVHLADLAWRCRIGEDGAAVLGVTGRLVAGEVVSGRLSTSLMLADETVFRDELPLEIAAGGAQALDIELRVPRPRLWSPDDPTLHRLTLRWPGGGLALPVGLRDVRIEGDRLLLNGRRIWLQGFGMHEEWPGHGPCVPAEHQRRELTMLKREYAINALRLGHYPHHPRTYRLCDELGLLVFTEIPAWQISRGRPWLASDVAWADWLQPQLAEMVDHYRAFTSVVSWGAGNENTSDHADAYYARALAYLAERDPSRLPIAVTDSSYELRFDRHQPLVTRNYHYGWYHSKRVYAIRDHHRRIVDASGGKPIWIAELGGLAARGRLDGAYNRRSRGSEFYQDHTVRFAFQYLATRDDAVTGISVWTWADFFRPNTLERHGVVDHRHRPKLVCSTLRGIMGGGPHRLFGVERTAVCEPGGRFQAVLHAFRPDPEAVAGEFRVRWSIRTAEEEAAGDTATFAADGNRSQAVASVDWPIPEDAAGHHALWYQLETPEGEWLHGGSIPFGVGAPERPGLLVVPAESAPAALWWDGLRIPVHRHPGLILPLDPGIYRFEWRGADRRAPLEVTIRSGERSVVDPAALPAPPGD